MDSKKIVCLGGGIGTVNLIKGLRNYFNDIAVVISMADDGGSAGRLRRLFKTPPTGDLVSLLALAAETKNPVLAKLLTYRFKGNRYGEDEQIGGQKLGNLVMTAMQDITEGFEKAIKLFQETFDIKGKFLPATTKAISIYAKTVDGKIIYGEENIDLGKYPGKRILQRVYLNPENVKTNPEVSQSLKNADIIIAGPGDLYTTILPVLIIKGIKELLQKSKALKIFVVNVANKPFETKGYSVSDYINAVKKHLGSFPFDKVIVNNNLSINIPKQYKYDYVNFKPTQNIPKVKIITADIIDRNFPLYHDPLKLAKTIKAIV